MRRQPFLLRASIALLLVVPANGGQLRAQPAAAHGAPDHRAPARDVASLAIGAHAIGLVTRAAPAFDGRTFTEGYLTQPMVMAHAALPRWGVRLTGTLNLEGLTLDRGELNGGIYGEGYVDRRHPHTLVHEAIATVGGLLPGAAGARWSLAAGKGFAPFGTDDPMSRPFVKFPVNHHLSQILERYVAVAGVRAGALMVELGAFNGDEPAGAYGWPTARRFGDSWAARATLLPIPGTEFATSVAAVASPEFQAGGGLDQRKLNVSARYARPAGRGAPRYLLAEYALTDDRAGTRRAFRYESLLAEGALGVRDWAFGARLERTTRPEEARLLDPFRSQRPHTDAHIDGITRWDIATVAVGRSTGAPAGIALRPLVEVARLRARNRIQPSAFDPRGFYGSDRMWSLSAGVRVAWGTGHGRMGRYGVAAAEGAPGHHGPASHGRDGVPPAAAR